MATNPDSLVLLGIAHDELEASIWRDVLAKEGIAILAKTADPFAPFGVPPRPDSIRVFVVAADEKRARWLLGEAIAAEDEATSNPVNAPPADVGAETKKP